jgi:hypothetical protein
LESRRLAVTGLALAVAALYLSLKKFRKTFGQNGLASVFGKDLRGTAATSLGYIEIQDEKDPF